MVLQVVSKKEVQGNSIDVATLPKEQEDKPIVEVIKQPVKVYKHNPFIVANTKEVNLSVLRNDCIIPVFSKDNEKTIAHQEFIQVTQDCVAKVFPHHTIDLPEVRISHQVKGRTSDAIYKNVNELLDHEKTQYFERMAFIIRIPSITETINGQELSLIFFYKDLQRF